MSKVSLVVSTFNRPEKLSRLIEMLKVETLTDWDALIMDESPDWYSRDMHGGDERITCYKMDRYNDWGYSVKEIGAQKATGEYLCFPADDAIYEPTFLEQLYNLGADLNYCDFIHNGSPTTARLETGHIDIGGFLVKRELFTGFPDKGNLADGHFAEQFKGTSAKVSEYLYIHE